MCDALQHAETTLGALGVLSFWREMTPFEREFGDIGRVADDFDSAERATAAHLAPVVRQIVEQLVSEASDLIADGDLAGIAKLTPSYEGPLAKAIRESASGAVETGKAQIHDSFRRQRRTAFASLPPRRRPKLTKAYLTAKAEVQAKETAESISSAVRTQAVAQAAKGTLDEGFLTDIAAKAAETAIGRAATSVAREGIAVGRYTAIEDTADYIETITYSAILDNNVCDVCLERDGDELSLDEIDAAPNPDCIGEAFGNSCRCVCLIQYRRDENNRVA